MRENKHNDTYTYISTVRDVEDLYLTVLCNGLKVRDTKEITNARIALVDIQVKPTMRTWEDLGASYDEAYLLLNAVLENNKSYKSRIYDAKHYVFLGKEIDKAMKELMKEGADTRRANVSFPSTHCFESIQVLLRGDLMYVTVNMRSCNVYKNLMNDLCFAHFVAFAIAATALKGVKATKIVANIGSLHLFKGDVEHVL